MEGSRRRDIYLVETDVNIAPSVDFAVTLLIVSFIDHQFHYSYRHRIISILAIIIIDKPPLFYILCNWLTYALVYVKKLILDKSLGPQRIFSYSMTVQNTEICETGGTVERACTCTNEIQVAARVKSPQGLL